LSERRFDAIDGAGKRWLEAMRLSIVIEWANTRLNGVPRAWALLDVLGQQWQAIVQQQCPAALPPAACSFHELANAVPCFAVRIGAAAYGQAETATRILTALFDR
jgi:hypothetical protein